ncbi:MAG: MotA/TolQ/ExbB proton channel family protein [Fibrobacterota bacterium]
MISFSSLIGIVLSVAILAFSLHHETDDWSVYLSLPSFLIVFGGCVTVTLIGYRTKYAAGALLALLKIYMHQPITPKSLRNDVKNMSDWSRKVQDEGNTAFDALSKEAKDGFMQYIFQLASTGYQPDDLRNFGSTNIEEHYFRRLQESHILNSMGSNAPALGLVGTLLGLITMLGKLSDPSKLGPGLALALTATLYGLLFARFFFLPGAAKAKQILSIERFRHYLILEGVILLVERRPAMYVQDRLNSFLDRKNQYSPSDKK